MILVADAHVSTEAGAAASFQHFLAAVSGTDQDVLFLGDIFDLWIGFSRYEKEAHRQFLAWCAAERSRRSIYYLEGNHEYFVTKNHSDRFAGGDPERLTLPGDVLAVHGDAVDRSDYGNLFFRFISKSALGYWVLKLVPGGPRFAHGVKRTLNSRQGGKTAGYPEDLLRAFAGKCFARGFRTVFMGHYHAPFVHETGDGCLYVAPAWCGGERIGLFDESAGTVRFGFWQDLL